MSSAAGELLASLGAAVASSLVAPAAHPYSGDLPDGFGLLLVDAGAGAPPLSPAAAAWVHERLRLGGYHPAARNFGAVRCLLPHIHGLGLQCVTAGPSSSPVYLRRFDDDTTALARLLVLAHFASLGGDVAPLPRAPAAPSAGEGVGGYRSLAPSSDEIEAESLGGANLGSGFLDYFSTPSELMEKRVQKSRRFGPTSTGARGTTPSSKRSSSRAGTHG